MSCFEICISQKLLFLNAVLKLRTKTSCARYLKYNFPCIPTLFAGNLIFIVFQHPNLINHL